MFHVMVSHDAPTYTQGRGHLRTRVYGATRVGAAPAPVFADAVEIDQFTGTFRAIPSNPATTWHLWIRWETQDGVLSASPAGGTNGLVATTAQDVSLLLDALAGEIRASELASSLATPIGQIPSISGIASAALAQAQANLAAIGTMQAEIADLSGTPNYDPLETYLVDRIVRYNGGLYRATATTTGNLPTNTAFWVLIGNYASLGDAVAGHAAILADHETRITNNNGAITAQAGQITTLQSGLTTANQQIALRATTSAVQALDTRVTQVEGVNTSQSNAITNLQSTTNSLNDGLAAAASATNALGTRVTNAENVNTAQSNQILALDAAITNPTTGLASKASLTQLSQVEASANSAVSTAQTLIRAEMDARSLGLPLTQWRNLNGQQIATVGDGRVGNQVLRLNGISGGFANQGTFIPIDRAKTYRTSFWARPSANNADGLLYFSLYQFTDAGAGPVSGGRAPYKPGGVSPSQHNATYGAQQWGFYSFTWTNADWQAGVTRVLPEFLDNYPTRPGHWDVQGFEFTDVTATESLSAQVTTIQQAQTTQGQSIASLTTAVQAAQQTADGRATVGSVNAVNARVDTTDAGLALQGQSIQGLQSALPGKADASALTQTNTNVANLAGTVSAQSEQITTLQSSVQRGQNLAAVDWWAPGASLPPGWAFNGGPLENSFVAGIDHTGVSSTLLRMEAGANGAIAGEGDGGFDGGRFVAPIDRTKTYRFVIPVRKDNALAASLYWGIYGVCDINTGNVNENPYFTLHSLSGRPLGEWYLAVGYVFPVGSTGRSHQGAGLYHATTGERVLNVESNWCWHPTNEIVYRAYQYYAEAGSIAHFGKPMVHIVDGSEPPLESLLAGQRNLTASLQVEATTRAAQTGELYAQYTVKTDVGGLISGYGLASTANNAAPTSAFGVQAGQFFVAPPTVNQATAPTANLFRGFVWRNSTTGLVQYWTGSAWSTTPQALPFVVQAVPTTVNGVSVPAGVYMADAFIQNGTITNAKIGNLAVDTAKIADLAVSTAKISDAAITTAKIANAAIGTAQIGTAQVTTANIADLSVSTLKIQNQAVTLPASASVFRNIDAFPGQTHSDLVVNTLAVISTGTPAFIFCNGLWRSASGTGFFMFELAVDGIPQANYYVHWSASNGNPIPSFISTVLTLSPGPHTLTLRYYETIAPGTIRLGPSSILYLEVKK